MTTPGFFVGDAISPLSNRDLTHRRVAELLPYARNARTHSPEQVAQLVRSIGEFGWTNPVLIDESGGIIAGHGRVLAAKEIGLERVPCIVVDGLTEQQRRALVIADNKLALNADWDFGALADELAELDTGDFDMALTGFDAAELEQIATWAPDGARAGLTDPDAVPPAPAVPVSAVGDVWLLERHRLACGDCTAQEAIACLMRGSVATMLWTDPPYGVRYVGKTADRLRIKNDDARGLPALLASAWESVSRALMPGSPFYIARPAGAPSITFGNSIVERGWRLHEELQWVKDSMVLGHSDYHLKHETIMYGWLPGEGRSGRGKHIGTRWFGGSAETSVFEIPRPKSSPDHPTGKPVELVRRHIENSTERGNIIVDPFVGSGTTIIAAEQTGRACYAVEIEPAYVDICVKRWQAFTGQQARRESDGALFDDLSPAQELVAA